MTIAATTWRHRARAAGVKTLPACRLNFAYAKERPGASPRACRRRFSPRHQAL